MDMAAGITLLNQSLGYRHFLRNDRTYILGTNTSCSIAMFLPELLGSSGGHT